MKIGKKFLSAVLTLCMVLSVFTVGIINASAESETQVKNVIFMIGDGMGKEQVEAGAVYKGSNLVFQDFTAQTTVTTSSLSGTTDSAAAATAMSTGVKTKNSNLGLDKDGNKVENLVEFSKNRGLKTGVVATQVLPHATPAGFTAHVTSRYSYNTIAVQQIMLQPDVLMGGGATYFTGREELLEANNFTVAKTFEEASNAPADKNLLGIFDSNYITADEEPKLAQMTELTLSRLTNENGFFTMIEGSDIDSYCHQNDMNNMLKELMVFDDAVKVAKDYVDNNPGTLLIVTADHETGGLNVPDGATKSDLKNALFTSESHTGADVGLYAYGTGAEKLCENAKIDNTDIQKFIAAELNATYGEVAPTDFTNYNDYRIFFEKPESWEGVKVYVKVDSSLEPNSFTMTNIEDNIYAHTFFEHEDISEATTLSFADTGNSGEATQYVAFEGYYKLYSTETGAWTDFAPTQGTIYFEKPATWSDDVYIYTAGTCYYGVFPGTKMDKVEGSDNIYQLVISDDAMGEEFLEFTAVFSDGVNKYQTTDINYAGMNKVFRVFGSDTTDTAYGCWYDYPYIPASPDEATVKIYLADETEWNIKQNNAALFVQCDGDEPIPLTYEGKDDGNSRVWSAEIPKNTQAMVFLRKDSSYPYDLWNVFTPISAFDPVKPYYALTEDAGGYWDTVREITPDDVLEKVNTPVTLYYAVPQAIIDAGYTVKLNRRLDKDAGVQEWSQSIMTDTGNTYNGKKIYTGEFLATYGGIFTLQFQNYMGNTWKSQTAPINESWTDAEVINGKLFDGAKFVDYTPGTDVGNSDLMQIYFDATKFSWYTGAAVTAYDKDMNILTQQEPLASTAIPEGYTTMGTSKSMFYTGKIPADSKYIEFFRIDGDKIYNYCCSLDNIEETKIEILGNCFALDGEKQSSGYRSGAWCTIGESNPTEPVPTVPETDLPTTAPATTYILGDADASGVVNIKDATLIQKHSANLLTISGTELVAADVDVSGIVNVRDATAIQKYVANIETGFEIGLVKAL
ncbi:MAG: alkaline phosphatase [Eubacteriales bacterium]|nr:alkaline phosphatase [Eubacteriales bacterium]